VKYLRVSADSPAKQAAHKRTESRGSRLTKADSPERDRISAGANRTSGAGDINVPIPIVVIEHARGKALLDSGLHPDRQHDPAGRLGERLTGPFRLDIQPGEEVSARLEAIDRDPAI
jgi:hypothetical protein